MWDPPSLYCVGWVIKERLMSQELEIIKIKKRRTLRGLEVDVDALVVSGNGGVASAPAMAAWAVVSAASTAARAAWAASSAVAPTAIAAAWA